MDGALWCIEADELGFAVELSRSLSMDQSTVCRLLPDLELVGSRQMALDEALLNVATGTVVRLYTWSAPTLSLGYFQKAADVRASLPDSHRDMAMVRRITGGGAIWHEFEVTYALVGTLGVAGLPPRTKDCYPHLHGHLQQALAQCGAGVDLAPADVGDRAFRSEVRCFAAPAQDDLLRTADGVTGKVVGSAGRTHGDRVLIHGSLKIASNVWDQEVVAGCGLPLAEARQALFNGLRASLTADFVDDDLTDAERAAWDDFHTMRYVTADWVEHRRGPRP